VIGFIEQYYIDNNELNVIHTFIKEIKEDEKVLQVISSPLTLKKYYINASDGVSFNLLDQSEIPLKHNDVASMVEIKNSKGVTGGVAILKGSSRKCMHGFR